MCIRDSYYLYVILDIWSRYVTGWMLARCESAALSTRLMNESIAKQGITKGQLTLHADRGSPMIAKPVVHLLACLLYTSVRRADRRDDGIGGRAEDADPTLGTRDEEFSRGRVERKGVDVYKRQSFHSSSDSHRWDDERDFRPRRETRKLSTADLCNKRFLASLKPSEAFLARLPLVIPGSVAAILR